MKLRVASLVAAVAGSLALALSLHPIPQSLAYHRFADQRAWFGIPHFMDVVSNVPFLLIGLAGVSLSARKQFQGARLEWLIFFAGVALVAFGSGYYHWSPSNDTLAWDRLPMTIAFMALLAAMIGETISPRAGYAVLVPALLVGAASVIYWQLTDDLRLYGWVQFFPLILIPLLLTLFPGRFGQWRFLAGALGCYVLSKVLEAADDAVFRATGGLVAGHALKHLSAAGACLILLVMLKRRATLQPVGSARVTTG